MNMTGDPNQQNGANLFGVNYSFAPTANPVDWTKFPNPPATLTNPMMSNQPMPTVGSAFPQPQDVSFSQPIPLHFPQVEAGVSFPPPRTPLANYSFGAGDNSRPEAAPVQFPFPVASTSTAGGDFGSRLIPLRCKRKTDSPP